MELETIIMMIVVLSFVWGGFIFFIFLAWIKEKVKNKQ
jgi:hypothetical protein